MSNFVILAFPQEKMKTVDFSETSAASDLRVSRCRHIIELMQVGKYGRSRAQSRVHTQIQTVFSQEQLCCSEPNFV